MPEATLDKGVVSLLWAHVLIVAGPAGRKRVRGAERPREAEAV
jgi:hypothetical protein